MNLPYYLVVSLALATGANFAMAQSRDTGTDPSVEGSVSETVPHLIEIAGFVEAPELLALVREVYDDFLKQPLRRTSDPGPVTFWPIISKFS